MVPQEATHESAPDNGDRGNQSDVTIQIPDRLRATAERVRRWLYDWTGRKARLLVIAGLLYCIIATARDTKLAYVSPAGVYAELYKKKEDIHNLYFAASQARWRDMPHWFVGSWIYPNVGFYRPLTSVLYFFEYRLFDRDFTRWNYVTVGLHALNVGLVFLLTVSLTRHWRRCRALFGLIAAFYFSTAYGSLYYSVARVLEWWPAQNDVLSLTFGLLSLVLLDEHLVRPRTWKLIAVIVSLYLSIAAKEMGFMVAPIGLVLTTYRCRGRWRTGMMAAAAMSALTGFMWFFRRIVIPNHWGPVMFRWQIAQKAMMIAFGPAYLMGRAQTWWPAAAGAAITVIVAVGLRWRWRIWVIAVICAAAAALCTQFVDEEGTFLLLMEGAAQGRLVDVLVFFLATCLFIRYWRSEAGYVAALAFFLAYLPVLHYFGGRHYHYWPSAFLGVADGLFIPCLLRWAVELRESANWTWSKQPIASAEQEASLEAVAE